MTTQQRKSAESDKETNPGTPVTPLESSSPDVQVAAKNNISEGEVKQLRFEAGMNQLPGHQANLSAWEASEDGKAFIKTAKDRDKEAEAGAKAAHADLDKDGVSEAEKRYFEATDK